MSGDMALGHLQPPVASRYIVILRLAPAAAKPSDFPPPAFDNHLTLQMALSDSEWVATQAFLSTDHTLTFPSNDL